MKIAILGDIHSNLEALDAVLEDAEKQQVDKYVVTGDIVGYNANPKTCIQRIRALKCAVVQGNHDFYASSKGEAPTIATAAQDTLAWTRKQLTYFDRKFLRDLPHICDVETFTIVHSSLNQPDRWRYVLQPGSAERNFLNQFTSVCFYGHTHIPAVFIQERTVTKGIFEEITLRPEAQYLINVGSVGQPRDGDPNSAYAVFDLERNHVEIRRIPYDIEKTCRKIIEAGLPAENATRLKVGK